MSRYERLMELCRKEKPKSVLEIGTWNGDRANQFLSIPSVKEYYGFDLFDYNTPELCKAEMNAKMPMELMGTMYRIKSKHPNKEVVLIGGDTRGTLIGFHKQVDFVFVDGGHSVATIINDLHHAYRVVKPGGLIVADDVYIGRSAEFLHQFGANIPLESYKFELFPEQDPLQGGGTVTCAVIRKGDHGRSNKGVRRVRPKRKNRVRRTKS